ncbi:MAG: TRAP transporter small permease [Rhodospirillaceae bacterium]|nr:TRAP transporter small permease [Rhodospirillaceae bacterium]
MKDRALWLGLKLTNMTEIVAAVLLVAVIMMNIAQVFFRYVLVDPLSWTGETMRYSTTWMVMLAGSAALFRGEHMVISLFDSVKSAKVRNFVRILVLACIGGFCVLLIWQGIPAAISNMRQSSPAMQIPMTIPYLAVPVGATLMLIKVLCLMILPEDALKKEEAKENES